MIAPFLVHRCGLEGETNIRFCAGCDIAFFERRLSEPESAALYSGYRGDAYNLQRIGFDSYYQTYVDLFADPLSTYYTDRVADYLDVMETFPEIRPRRILDFGGDGSLPRRVFPYADIVFDDVSLAADPTATHSYDMIFASQVLEHLSDPLASLQQIGQRLAPDGVMFVDVPRDVEVSLAEGFLRQSRSGGALFYMHEHITYFSRRSLGLLLVAAGFEPFFEVTPARQTTFLALAVRPSHPLAERFRSERLLRTLSWSHTRPR